MTNPPNQDPRQTRHLALLERLTDLAMAQTEAAAAKAQQHIKDPEPGPDPVLTFIRLATSVRQLIALEARIANPAAPGERLGPKPVDEAREFIAEATRAFAKADPAATRRHGPTKRHIERAIDERMDAEDITALIEEDMPAYVIVSTICDDLGVRCEVEEQPDENLIPLSEALELRQVARTPIKYDVDYEEDDPLSPFPLGEDWGEGPAKSTKPHPGPTTNPPEQHQ